jgi:serine/threonine protein kinase
MEEQQPDVVKVPCTDHHMLINPTDIFKGVEGEYDKIDTNMMKLISANSFSAAYSNKDAEFISHGSYGEVFRCKTNHGMYAIKKYVMDNGDNELNKFHQNNCMEIIILKSIHHPNVVRILDASIVGGCLYAAFDNYDNDLHSCNFKKLYEHHRNWRLLMMKHISHALAFLHGQQIIHRDIKPSNILYRVFPSESGKKYIHFALCDFGAAIDCKFYDHPVVVQTKVTTCTFEAPEMMFRSRMYTSSVDIFALGCVLYYVMSNGDHLLPNIMEKLDPSNRFAIIQARINHATDIERAFFSKLPDADFPKIDQVLSLRYYHLQKCKHIGVSNALMQKMVTLHPDNRPTARQVNFDILAIIDKQREAAIANKKTECKVL